jgi:hypothetical protein
MKHSTKRLLLLLLFTIVYCIAVSAQTKYVFSDANDGFVNVRKAPNAQADIIEVLYNGREGAKLLDETNRFWYKVEKSGVIGYVNKRYSKVSLEEDAFNELSNKNAPQTIQKKNPLDLLDMGMTQSECLKILGKPDDILKSASNNSIIEQWYYYDKYWLKFVNGYLLVYADMKSYKKNMQIIQDFFKK